MKAKLLLDSGAPKVPPSELRRIVLGSGLEVSTGKADFGIVVGGDGRFGWYGRTEDLPLLFVGVRTKHVSGSRALLAQTTYDELPIALTLIRSGRYSVVKHRRLAVFKDGKLLDEIFTDVYLQRGSESTCIRYRVEVSGPGIRFGEDAIGDGVVVTTRAGASGYYSYLDRIKGERMDPSAHAKLGRDEVGVCHVSPTFTQRGRTWEHPLRYRVPWGTKVGLSLFRDADARLYGVSDGHSGIRIELGDKVTVAGGKGTTRVISLAETEGRS